VENQVLSADEIKSADAEAINHLRQAIANGRQWYMALLETIGLWRSAEEVYDGRKFRYLIQGEAFDWLLLAERLCSVVEGLLPEDEKDALLFHGKPPAHMSAAEVKELIGSLKYTQYLNYFYGIVVEEALALAVQEEVLKERRISCYLDEQDTAEEASRRIYGTARALLLRQFRKEKKYPRPRSITLDELKEFTYWLFKYRLMRCDKAKIASDTKKALKYLERHWAQKGVSGVLVADRQFNGQS